MSSMVWSRVLFSADGKRVKRISGHDMQAPMPIVAHHGNKLVFKRNGFTGWTSRGETGYYPPMYFMVKLDGDVICQVIDEIEVNSQTWRKVRHELASKAVLTAYD